MGQIEMRVNKTFLVSYFKYLDFEFSMGTAIKRIHSSDSELVNSLNTTTMRIVVITAT
jgi:hypothetical protein